MLTCDDIEAAGDRPVVVLLHGFACNRTMWHHQARFLQGRAHVIAVDLPGHGQTRMPADPASHTEDGIADLVCAELEERGIRRAVMVGFSMGGGVALNMASRHPLSVGGLLLADVGGGSADPVAHRATMRTYTQMLETEGLDAFVDYLIQTPIFCDFANRDSASHDAMRSIMMTCDPEELTLILDGVLSRRKPVQERDLEAISVPTEVLLGEFDAQCRQSSAELAGRIVGAEHTVLQGIGHMTPLENPQAFNSVLARLLSRVENHASHQR